MSQDVYARADAAKAQAAADSARRDLAELQAQMAKAEGLNDRLTRIEQKLDTIGILLYGRIYADNWGSTAYQQIMEGK